LDSYIRRLDFEQERQAVHVLNAYIKAMGGKTGGTSVNGASAPPGGKQVSGGDLLSMMRKRTV
jgi:hypothetical protein